MENITLAIRITTDDEQVVEELCTHAVSWAYIQEGELIEFLAPKVNFHVYIDTYWKAQNVRDFIRRRVGNGNPNYSMKKIAHLSIKYFAYMLKGEKEKGYSFRHFNIPEEVLKTSRVYDEKEIKAKRAKHDGGMLSEFKSLLPTKPTDLEIRELILKYYHDHQKPFNYVVMKAQYEHLKYHYKLEPKTFFLTKFESYEKNF